MLRRKVSPKKKKKQSKPKLSFVAKIHIHLYLFSSVLRSTANYVPFIYYAYQPKLIYISETS